MTIVASYDWESDTFTHHGENGARAAWREAVAEIAAKAHEKLPECNGRVDKAVALVLDVGRPVQPVITPEAPEQVAAIIEQRRQRLV